MKRTLKFILLPLVLLNSCSEFIEPQLEKQQTTLLAPGNQTETQHYLQTFWWEYLKGASKYQLQIVAPNFDNPITMILDTTINLDKFEHSLSPGTYQWRVRGMNNSSVTPYETRTLTIQSSSIKDQQVQPERPTIDHSTNQARTNFQWQMVYGATHYQFQLDDNDFANPSMPLVNLNTTDEFINYIFIQSGDYQWRVRAINNTETSKWSTVRRVNFDNIPPVEPVITAPKNGQTVVKPTRLQWNAIVDAQSYEVSIFRKDGSTLVSQNYPLKMTTNYHSFELGTSGEKYFWKLRSIDKAGNSSDYSEVFAFIQQ